MVKQRDNGERKKSYNKFLRLKSRLPPVMQKCQGVDDFLLHLRGIIGKINIKIF
jgi:hypothetical protein